MIYDCFLNTTWSFEEFKEKYKKVRNVFSNLSSGRVELYANRFCLIKNIEKFHFVFVDQLNKEYHCLNVESFNFYLEEKMTLSERSLLSAVSLEHSAYTNFRGLKISLKGASIEKIKNYQKTRSLKYADTLKISRKAYGDSDKNKERARIYFRKYEKNRRATDPLYKIKMNLRCRIRNAINNGYKSKTTLDLIGCSIPELKQKLELAFKEGMTWENYGSYWHIDHILPCCSFDLTKPEEQQKCFHYSNLQPLTAKENSVKGARILPEHQHLISPENSA